jgi:hypothetical protein
MSDERFERRHGALELAERKMKMRDSAALEVRLQLLRNACQRGAPDNDDDDDDDSDDDEEVSPWSRGSLVPRCM